MSPQGGTAPDVATWVLLGSFAPSGPDALHDLIRAVRGGDATAMDEILGAVRAAAGSAWPDLADAVVVGVPGHLDGPASALVTAIAVHVAAVRGWTVSTAGLVRAHAVDEAKAGGRRDAAAEAGSLVWSVGAAVLGGAIVLVDDVVRSGGTLRACAVAIRAAGDPRPVVAVVAARAEEHATG